MKRFSLFLMIVLLVSAIFISCSAEPAADATSVAEVAINFSKAPLSATSTATTTLPGVETLYWYYTATKTDGYFSTGATTEKTEIRTTNGKMGLPAVIGETSATYDTDGNLTGVDGAFFSTGTWSFSFYGYDAAQVGAGVPSKGIDDDGYEPAIYSCENASVTVSVNHSQFENLLIGGDAEISLSITNDPRTQGTVTIQNITVDFGNSFVSNAGYKLSVYANGSSSPIASTTSYTAIGNKVSFYSGTNPAAELAVLSSNGTFAPGFYTLAFVVTKGEEGPEYAKGEISIHARLGYNVTIEGDLNSLESVAYVQIHNNTTVAIPQAQNENVFTISSEDELRAFAAYVNQGNNCAGLTIKLTNDITLHGDWTPIGNSYRGQENGAYFAGTFDGRKSDDSNYTISGLTDGEKYVPANAKSNGEYSYGLFGIVKNATIKNINLTGVDIKSNNNSYTADEVGAVVGYSLGSLKLDNITVSGSVVGDNVGGIIGRAYGNSGNETIVISNCTNQATVSSLHIHNSGANSYTDRAAGIAGYINGLGARVTVEECINSGNITVGSAEAVGNNIIAGICCYGFNTNVYDRYTFDKNKSTGNLTVLGTSGNAHVARIVVMCNQAKEDSDTYSFTEPTEDYTVGTITVFGTTRATDDVPKETH